METMCSSPIIKSKNNSDCDLTSVNQQTLIIVTSVIRYIRTQTGTLTCVTMFSGQIPVAAEKNQSSWERREEVRIHVIIE